MNLSADGISNPPPSIEQPRPASQASKAETIQNIKDKESE
jgi:hypothetical protein